MDWLKMMGFCLLCAVMVLILRQMNPQMAGILAALFGVMLASSILPELAAYIDRIMVFIQSLDLDEQYFRILLKAMGIVLVTQFAVQMCCDLDAPSIAQRAELCGRIALFGVAAPVFMHLTEMAVSILR